MELAQIIKALRNRRLLTVGVVLIATAAAAAVKLEKHSVPTGTATAQLMVDSPQSVIADLKQDTIPLTTRASVFAQFMASALIQQRIAAVMGVPVDQITTEGPFGGAGETLNVVTPSEARGPQIAAEKKLYRLTFVAQDQLPLVTVSAQAPTPAQASKLADAVFSAVNGYLQSLQAASRSPSTAIPERNRVTLRQLGAPQVGSQSSSQALVLMVAAFAGLLLLGLLAVLVLEKVRPKRAESASAVRRLRGPEEPEGDDALFDRDRPTMFGEDDLPYGLEYDLSGAGRRDGDISPRSPTPIG